MLNYLNLIRNYLVSFLRMIQIYFELKLFYIIPIICVLFNIGCGSPNNTLEGFKPNNPVPKTTNLPTPEPQTPIVDHYIQGKEFTSLSQKNRTTTGGYQISATMGDQLPSGTKITNSGHFKVEYTIQGQLNSIK